MVFLDTVGLLALWDEDDQWHEPAAQAFARLADDAQRMVTTWFVLLECGNALACSPFRQDLDEFREQLESGGRLVQPTKDDWADAWLAYKRGREGAASVVDQVSFAIMRRLGRRRAFTNDQHFRAAGFEVMF